MQYDVVVAVTANAMKSNAAGTWEQALLHKLRAEHGISFDDSNEFLAPAIARAGIFNLDDGLAHFGAWLESFECCSYVGPVVGFIAVSLSGVTNPTELLLSLARCALGPVLRIVDHTLFQPVRELPVLVADLCGRFGSFDDDRAGLHGFCGENWDNKLSVGLFTANGSLMSTPEASIVLGGLEVSLLGFDPSVFSHLG
jgi:hypothetical protein